MTQEEKIRLFERMFLLDQLAEKQTFDDRDYFEQADGAFQMLEELRLGREYCLWADSKLEEKKK